MLSLGIDTSTKTGYLALVEGDRLLLEDTIDAELDHSARLLPTLQSALERSRVSQRDIECIGAGVGPGSLTGVRVAIAFAKGLVFAVGRPLVGISSLRAIAYRRRGISGVISVVVDAKMGGFYLAAYRWDAASMEEVIPPSLLGREELAKNVPAGSRIITPDAGGIPAEAIARLPAGCEIEAAPVFPSAEYIAREAILKSKSADFDPEKTVEPVYLRPGVPGKARFP